MTAFTFPFFPCCSPFPARALQLFSPRFSQRERRALLSAPCLFLSPKGTKKTRSLWEKGSCAYSSRASQLLTPFPKGFAKQGEGRRHLSPLVCKARRGVAKHERRKHERTRKEKGDKRESNKEWNGKNVKKGKIIFLHLNSLKVNV